MQTRSQTRFVSPEKEEKKKKIIPFETRSSTLPEGVVSRVSENRYSLSGSFVDSSTPLRDESLGVANNGASGSNNSARGSIVLPEFMRIIPSSKDDSLILQKVLDTLLSPDFDEASRAWRKNKRNVGNGCFVYIR